MSLKVFIAGLAWGAVNLCVGYGLCYLRNCRKNESDVIKLTGEIDRKK